MFPTTKVRILCFFLDGYIGHDDLRYKTINDVDNTIYVLLSIEYFPDCSHFYFTYRFIKNPKSVCTGMDGDKFNLQLTAAFFMSGSIHRIIFVR